MSDFAIGIDLGTTNSCVAIYLNGRVEVLANEVGERTTPSFVGYKNEEILMGKIAKLQAHKNIENTIFDVKRLMGKNYNDSQVQESIKYWPFTVANREGHPALRIKCHDEEVFYCPEEISAEILKKLKDVASKRVEAPVTKAVITVPAYFNDSQRQATKDAGKLAGLEVLMLLNEPTAAAITYALDKCSNDCKYALIFDLGGGTFDVSIIKFENRRVTVKAIYGDSHLGGNDFDIQLLNYLIEDIESTFNSKIQDNHRTLSKLRSACEKAKRLLSFQNSIEIDFDAISDGNDYCIELTRKKFEDLNEELFSKTIEIVKNCLVTASLTPADIDNVVLVGGSTKIPRIKYLLQRLFEGKTLSEAVNPDEAVVIGAAIQAANLNKHDSQVVEDFILEDVVPFSLGIETAPDGLMFNVIERYTLLPATVTKPFTTVCDNQIKSNIQIYEGENKFAHDNHLLGSFTLSGFPPAPKGATKVDVTFNIDVNGILTVTATERLSKKTNNITITKDRCFLSKKEVDTLNLSWDTFYQNFSKSKFSELD